MLISIHDSSLRRVAYMDNVVPLAMHYADGTWRRLLKEATSTFTFKVDMLGRDNEQYLTDDAYISFKYNDRQYLFNVMTITPDSGSKSIIVYCENLSLELLNEMKAPIDITTSRNLLWYLNNDGLLNNAGITLGINEVSDKTAKIKLESEQTGLARLTSIANIFDAEIELVTELNGDGTLKSMTVNFFKKYDGVSQGVGTYRRDLILEYGRNVDGIKRTIDKTDLYNAITPTGKDGLNITSLEKKEYDENGNLEYYTKKGSPNIFAPQSKARYKAQLLNDTDGWLRRHYPADGTSNVNTLYSLALNELKKHAYPAITYEVTGFYDLDIGDTVRIVDHSFTPTLTIQARVAEQSICFSDPTKNKTTFGNFLALESRVSQDLTGRLKELVDQVTPYRFEIVSDNGLTFKNSTGSTTLTARVYKGSNIDEVSVDSFEWLIDGVSFGSTAKSQLVSASQVTGTAVVRYNAKLVDTVIGGIEVTLQYVSDGTDGVSPTVTINQDTSLTIVDAQGTRTTPVLKGSDGVPGKDGVGINSTTIAYAISSSGTVTPTTGWNAQVPTLVKGQYLWTKTVWNYSDTTSETGYSVTYISKDGNNGTDGLAGKDGVGIKTTAITYAKSTNGTTAPTSGWITSVPIAVAGDYIWTKTVWTYTDNTTETGYSVGKIGNTGLKGDKGADGIAGKDGKGITGTVITYGLSTSETTQPSTWTSSVPGLVKGQYLWTKTVWTYTDNSSETGYSVTYISKDGNNGTDGIAGKDGVGIKATAITYAKHTNGTTAPTTGYTTAVPSVPAGQFLWTKTVWTYTDNSTETGYSVAMMGVKGDKGDPGNNGTNGVAGKDGKGIKATAITYQASTNGTTAPIGTWSDSVPTVAKGSFLWTRTIWTYTDNTTETGYAVAYMGTNGNNGTNGLAGKDGVGINSTTITYVGSTSGTTAPTSGWTSAVPTVVAGNYLWTKTVWTYTDNTSETGYSVARMGLKGDKGDPGIKGSDGTSGIIVSSVAPTSPKTGQLWQDTSTTPQLVKKWTGTSWVIWEFYAENIKAVTLETVSAKIGKIYNEFDNSSGGIDNKGTITIKDSVKVVYYLGNSSTTIDLVASSSGQGLFTQYLPNKTDASKFKQSWYMPTGLYFNDSINNWNGQITAENVTLVPWTNLILNSGYKAGDGVQPQYRRIKNLDGSYAVQFRGAISPTSGNFSTTQVWAATLSGVYLPPTIAMRQGSDNSGKGARVVVEPSGRLSILAPNTSAYVYIDALTYIN